MIIDDKESLNHKRFRTSKLTGFKYKNKYKENVKIKERNKSYIIIEAEAKPL